MRVGTGVAGLGLGSIVIVLIASFLGVDPTMLLNDTSIEPAVDSTSAPLSQADEETGQFVRVVLGYTEDTWSELFREAGRDYKEPTLVLFSGTVRSACGFGQAAMGPFYCPGDEQVYLDTSFFQELRDKFQAPGDFAQAYVIAHEVGHHVQNLLGISEQVDQARQRSSEVEANRASVRLELQADCFAGVWANRTEQTARSQFKEFLEAGDFEEALRAASSVGDDRLQKQSQGYVVPESFTHGTAEQRMTWFRRGFQSGQPDSCNTFN
jgi:predicted metalloprotease